jgi:hypothetical protein
MITKERNKIFFTDDNTFPDSSIDCPMADGRDPVQTMMFRAKTVMKL